MRKSIELRRLVSLLIVGSGRQHFKANLLGLLRILKRPNINIVSPLLSFFAFGFLFSQQLRFELFIINTFQVRFIQYLLDQCQIAATMTIQDFLQVGVH